jgi:hypothetical protein
VKHAYQEWPLTETDEKETLKVTEHNKNENIAGSV